MKSKSLFFVLFPVATLALLTGCVNDTVSPGAQVGRSVTYKTIGNNLITTGTDYVCGSDGIDSISFQDTVTFEVKGYGLVLNWVETDFSVPVQFTETFVGGGGGIQGAWYLAGQSYKAVDGQLDSAEIKELNQEVANFQKTLSFGTRTYVFTADSIYSHQNMQTAALFVAEWNGLFLSDSDKVYSDSAAYNISLKVVDLKNVKLKGLLSGETVTLTLWESGSKHYVSDSLAHTAYSYNAVRTPIICSQLYDEPAWWQDFLYDNLRSDSASNSSNLAKTGVAKKHPSFIHHHFF